VPAHADSAAENPSATVTRVGLISDTHGRLDPRAVAVLAGEAPLAAIAHAGDVGADPQVLWELEAIAPVTAVLGNCDAAIPGWDLAGIARLTVAGVRILVVHDFADLGPIPDDVDVVVRGHSHIPGEQLHGATLVVNPGSASQRRRQPSCTIGILELRGDGSLPALRIASLDE
jgi:putative phosphoesterase